MNIRKGLTALAATLSLMAGCEGMITGTEIANVSLTPAEGGGYAPARYTLDPSMNPLAFNLRADFSQDPAEFGKWNSYRAELKQGGAVVATRNFNVNHPQSNAQGDAPPPTGTVHTLFYVDVSTAGEYELTITPTKPVAITLKEPRVAARKNVQRPPQ